MLRCPEKDQSGDYLDRDCVDWNSRRANQCADCFDISDLVGIR